MCMNEIRSTYAFEKICEKLHPVLAEWMECIFTFFTSEFIKESETTHPKRYDYLFSALFADGILQPFPKESGIKDFDCIIYPSVAWGHIPDNVAILPEIIKTKFSLSQAIEYEVLETCYDKRLEINRYHAKLKFIRSATGFKNDYISWSDDV